MNQHATKFKIVAACLIGVIMSISASSISFASDPIRIVVLPFYSEEGVDVKAGGDATNHYRRMSRFINNQLVRHGFEVINPFAADAAERELSRVMERAREDSPLAGLEMCKKYGTDASYIVWLKVKVKKTDDGYCKASARLDGEGYDSAGHDLGAGLSKTFKVSRRDCDDAIAEVEKEVGDLVGRKLTAWKGTQKQSMTVVAPPESVNTANTVVGDTASTAATTGSGVLATSINKNENLVTVRLDMATDYALAEVFGKVVNTARGVSDAKLFSQRIVVDNPQASYIKWRLSINIDETEPFRLQTNIMKMIQDISDAGGTIVIKGVSYRYSPAEIELLKGIRPGDATTRDIQFVVDRDLAKDKELAGAGVPISGQKNTQGFD